MRRLLLSLILVACPSAAPAGDDEVQAPPEVPRAGMRPPSPATPSPSADAQAAQDARLEAIVDAAVSRALARQQAAQPAGQGGARASAQWSPPSSLIPPPSSPRPRLAIVAAEHPRAVGTVPAYTESRDYVQVLVPAPCHRRALAALGERMIQCGQPRVKTMRVAPAALVQLQEVPTVRPVYPSGQGG